MQFSKISEHPGKSAGLKFFDKPALLLVIIAVIGLIAYSNTFHVPFVFDDDFSITDNPVIKSLANFFSNSTGYDYNPRRFIGTLLLPSITGSADFLSRPYDSAPLRGQE